MNRKIVLGIAIFTIFALTMISSACATSRKDAALNFVTSCRKPVDSEGYFGNPIAPESQIATVENTFSAIQIINLLNGPVSNSTFSNALAIQSFLIDLRDGTTGGYKDFPGSVVTLQSTYQALQIAEYFDIATMLDRNDLNNNENFTKLSQNANGGFGANPSLSANATIFSTYFALKILNFTGNLTGQYSVINENKVYQFLQSCGNGTDLFSGSPNSATSIMATAFATMIYYEFLSNFTNLFTGPRTLAIVSYIKNNVGQYGGFIDPSIDNVATLSTTYYAVKTLSLLNIGIPNDDNNLTNWIMNHQNNNDGGFIEGDPSQTSSSILATYYAAYALNLVDSSAMNQDTPTTLTQIAGTVFAIVLIIVIVALIVIVYYVRKRNRI
ncbi:MAG TPA: prenyltransferase/squalene oxidase repeat-containing protein [Candidatus Lokiarchaeia archaeon]|nr:prenyltransferase/squalene oxidase repeat-containing protein [Candidatus Lokiarchaeia archaeon]